MKCSNIRIIGVPEEEDRKKDHEKILEEIIVENFPKMGKEIITQVQETQRGCPRWMGGTSALHTSFLSQGDTSAFSPSDLPQRRQKLQ